MDSNSVPFRNTSISHNSYYNDAFYDDVHAIKRESASRVLGFLFQYLHPASIVDVGCGRGVWLAVAEQLGVKQLRGYDGPWIEEDKLLSKTINFTAVDFSEDTQLAGSYDLCVSLEVAEHIEESHARAFVSNLCNLSDVVLFSAAIPEQIGTNHVNLQWQSYWIDIFGRCNYKCIDCLRPALWYDDEIPWFYRQNVFLFVSTSASLSPEMRSLEELAKPISDIVHTQHYLQKIQEARQKEIFMAEPPLRYCLAKLWPAFRRSCYRRIGKYTHKSFVSPNN